MEINKVVALIDSTQEMYGNLNCVELHKAKFECLGLKAVTSTDYQMLRILNGNILPDP